MNQPFGVQGEIKNFPFKDLHETFYNQDGVELEINNGVLFVGVDDEAKLEEAKDLARLYLAAWSERQQIKAAVDFNHAWQTNAKGHKDHSVSLGDSVKPVERLQMQTTTHQVTIKGTASIVTQQMHDSASFTNDAAMQQKAQTYPALKNALFYYNEEIVDDDRPLYGIYKAVEAMVTQLQTTFHLEKNEARKKLAGLAGQPITYVTDVIQTAEVKRHHKTSATRKISDDECRQRAKILIDAFASSLS
jgi:hypothetical protein